jgi:hypothetical protein
MSARKTNSPPPEGARMTAPAPRPRMARATAAFRRPPIPGRPGCWLDAQMVPQSGINWPCSRPMPLQTYDDREKRLTAHGTQGHERVTNRRTQRKRRGTGLCRAGRFRSRGAAQVSLLRPSAAHVPEIPGKFVSSLMQTNMYITGKSIASCRSRSIVPQQILNSDPAKYLSVTGTKPRQGQE